MLLQECSGLIVSHIWFPLPPPAIALVIALLLDAAIAGSLELVSSCAGDGAGDPFGA